LSTSTRLKIACGFPDRGFECILSLIYNTSERVATRLLKSISFPFFFLTGTASKLKLPTAQPTYHAVNAFIRNKKFKFQGFRKEMEYFKHASRKCTPKRAITELMYSQI
jgi:hypothetical protein